MGFWTDLANFACNCVFFVGNVIVDTALTVDEYIQKATGTNPIPDIQRQKIDIRNSLNEINLELQDLWRKYSRDGGLSHGDQERSEELRRKRKKQKEEMWNTKEAESAEKVRNNPTDVDSAIITPDCSHILQYHIGQATFKKKCAICGRDMVLQFPQGKMKIDVSEFFWGCTGYYSNACNNIERFQYSDGKLFTNDNINEFKCSKDDLATIYKATENTVVARMNNYRNQKADEYICPIHGEPLVLRKKKEATGALDQFFLGCSYWNGNNHGSCSYLVKMKSPAQLAAVLRHFEGRGIL